MAKILLRSVVFVLLLVLLAGRAYAISFGSVARSSFAEIQSSESAKFTLLFWNAEDDTYTLRLSEHAPENWIVIIDPEEFPLNRTTGEEYVSLAGGDVKAKVVNIFIKPDSNSKNGNYSVKIEAVAQIEDGAENAITIVPVRSFSFGIRLTGSAAAESESNEVTETAEVPNAEADTTTPQEGAGVFYLLVVIAVVAFSIIVYKKS
jgi:uncharacterized membrane protein